MSLSIYDTEHVDRFFRDIASWESAYTSSGFSYLAVKQGADWTIVHARVFLRVEQLTVSRTPFLSNRVAAGHVDIPFAPGGFRQLVDTLASGASIDLPFGRAALPKDASGNIGAFYVPLHPEGLTTFNRLPVLTLRGASRHGQFVLPDVDWEVRAAPEPYESLAELSYSYSLGGYSGDATAVEIVAQAVALVAHDSKVSGTVAMPSILLARTLDPLKCRIGYKMQVNMEVLRRGSVEGQELAWEESGSWKRGTATLGIPSSAALQCFASYAGVAQHTYWIGDPRTFQNQNRALFEVCDPELEVLRDFLFEDRKARKHARDFEVGVAHLATLLGFSVMYVGAASRLSEAPDIIATTPTGDTLVIECTIGLLKAENKLAKLSERTLAIKKALEASGHSQVRVIAALVTALDRNAVEAERGAAREAGVLVATKESLLDAVSRTIVATDARQIFEEMWNEAQQELPEKRGE
jgi:hypothetical protein